MAFFRKNKKHNTHEEESASPPASPKLNRKEPNGAVPDAPLDDEEAEKLEERKKLSSRGASLIGKDITSLVSLPVSLFEPITVLQSMCEPLRNVALIEKICQTTDPIDRICLVSTFCVSLFSYYTRTAKPFNPVLGETFEFIPQSAACKVIAEQVSHHPPVAIVQTTGEDWSLTQESRIETKFWGTSVDVSSLGNNVLRLTKINEEYSWKNPCAVIHNILLGKLWIEYHGLLAIKNLTTGEYVNLNFKKAGWFGSTSYEVSGEARDTNGNIKAVITGKWNEYVNVARVDEHGKKGTPVELWRRVIPDSERQHRWKWDSFVSEITATNADIESILPPTDSRLRADLRALTALDFKTAGREKTKIEERERQKRKDREAKGVKYDPIYFKKVPDEKLEYRWDYCGNYWEERDRRIEANKIKNLVSEKKKEELSVGVGVVDVHPAVAQTPVENA